MLVWHARDCAVRTLKVNGWYLTFPAGEGEKGGRYTLFSPPPTSNSTCNSRQEHTHTHGLSLSKFPPLDFPCWQKGKIARLYREKCQPQYFLNVDSQKRLLFGNSKRTELDIEIVQNYTPINALYNSAFFSGLGPSRLLRRCHRGEDHPARGGPPNRLPEGQVQV